MIHTNSVATTKNLNTILLKSSPKDIQSKILSICNTGVGCNVSVSKLTTILQRSKFLEDSIMKSNLRDMQKLIFNFQPYNMSDVYKSKLDSLNIVLDKWSEKEINLLRRKNEQIMNELNSVIYKKM